MIRSTPRKLAAYRVLAKAAFAVAAIACLAALIYSVSDASAQRAHRGSGEPGPAVADKSQAEAESGRVYTARELGFEGPASLLKWSARAHPEQVSRELRKATDVLGIPRSQLEAIGSCEAGGRPDAVSAGGTYRGKYQFSISAWGSVGGRGDPARAPEWEQDIRAALMIDARGTSPWPNCG